MKLWVWKPFIDNVSFIWTYSEEQHREIFKRAEWFSFRIKFNFEKSKMQVNFLDVIIKIKNGRLSTERCSKLVDSYQSLHYNSCQEEHIKKLSFTVKL